MGHKLAMMQVGEFQSNFKRFLLMIVVDFVKQKNTFLLLMCDFLGLIYLFSNVLALSAQNIDSDILKPMLKGNIQEKASQKLGWETINVSKNKNVNEKCSSSKEVATVRKPQLNQSNHLNFTCMGATKIVTQEGLGGYTLVIDDEYHQDKFLKAVITVQRVYRGYHDRLQIQRKHKAAKIVQSYFRKYLLRKVWEVN